ncbi:hypothetical protein GWK08_13795 [Leptobacterium flavescens]|uniref:Bacteriocin n=1 Tax=Leptobacterium flavescens TaxID=472055 RepID=A0A6P0UPT5_9FLAO|nr:hypothetical protein [Leptobacterium flavescens]NER14522.1 hypothetical protein [Leptobacterium flavescens]
MLKNILKLEGTQELGKNEQRQISGGVSGGPIYCDSDADCAIVCGKCVGFGICLHAVPACA